MNAALLAVSMTAVDFTGVRRLDELRLSDIEDRFVCTACGQRGADVRPDWSTARRRLTYGR